MKNNNRNWSNRYHSNFSMKTKKSNSFSSGAVSNELDYKNRGGAIDDPEAHIKTKKPESKGRPEIQSPYEGADVRNLPKHLYRPYDAESVDIRNLVQLDPNSTFRVLEFECPKGTNIIFLGYGVFSDALLESDITFRPKVNGKRIFPFHGNPLNNFQISLGLAPDLANSSLIECYLQLRPGDVLTWDIVNNSEVQVTGGVRMKGYIDSASLQVEQKFGG